METERTEGDLNFAAGAGDTPLFSAVKAGSLRSVVSVLSDSGADKDALTNDGTSALICACGGVEGVVPDPSIVKELLEAGVDVSVRTHAGMSALDWACQKGLVSILEALVKTGADVKSRSPVQDVTALTLAISNAHEQTALRLVDLGADLKFVDSDLFTPLHRAVEQKLKDLVSAMLQKGANKNATSWDSRTPLMLACASPEPCVDIVKKLLDAGVDTTVRSLDCYGHHSALDEAVRGGSNPVVNALLSHGVDANDTDNNGGSALHRVGQSVLSGFQSSGVIKALVEAGADIEKKDRDGLTPLAMAALFGKVHPLRSLLEHEASINVTDNESETPLSIACDYQSAGFGDVVDLLLRWGADETIVNKIGVLPADAVKIRVSHGDATQEEVARARDLLIRAPADRAWRRRGWILMIRKRASDEPKEDITKVVRLDEGPKNEVLKCAVMWLVGREFGGVSRTILGFL